MNYFENIIKKILEQQGKWVKQSVKVEITKQEKRDIGKHSIPRPEIDLVAYTPKSNKLEIWEVKSFLDSPGVRFIDISKEFKVPEGGYKLFTCENYRRIVFNRLVTQWGSIGLILPNPTIQFGLVVGNFRGDDEKKTRELFYKRGWAVIGPKEVRNAIKGFEKTGYENDPYVIASKIIFRNEDD